MLTCVCDSLSIFYCVSLLKIFLHFVLNIVEIVRRDLEDGATALKRTRARRYNEMLGRRLVRSQRLVDKAERVWANDQARRRIHVLLQAWNKIASATRPSRKRM